MSARRPVSTTAVVDFHDDDFDLDQSKVVLGDVLGKGAFSTVYKASYNGATVAIKVQSVLDADLERYLRKELAILRRCNHPGLVQFVGACRVDDDTYYIATEYCRGGDLRRLLESAKPLSWHQRAQILAGAADALAYLHERDMIHRDVKTENVLLDDDLRPKLCDFGFARTAPLTLNRRASQRKGKSAARPMTMCGTDEFMAPEVMFGMVYDEKADVFGLGVVMAETLARRAPGKRSGFLQRHPANGFAVEDADLAALTREFGAPESLAHLCARLLATEPADRPSARECADWLDELARELSAGAPPPARLTEAENLAAVRADLARRDADAKLSAETQDEDDVSAIGELATPTRMAAAELQRELQAAVMRAAEFDPPGDDDDDDGGDGDHDNGHHRAPEKAHGKAAPVSPKAATPKAAGKQASAAKPSAQAAAPPRPGQKAAAAAAAPGPSAARPPTGPSSKSSPRLLAGQDGAPGQFQLRAANRRSQLFHPMSGYLMKRGGRIKTWRSRFVVVTSEGLVYFRTKEDFARAPQDMHGSVSFRDMVKPPGQNAVADTVGFLVARRSNAFRVMTTARARFFQTPDAKLSEKWVRAINLAYSAWCLKHQTSLAKR